MRDLLEDIRDLVGVTILELSSHAAKLQKSLGDIKRLQTRADDITVRMRSMSKYDLAENMATITALDNDVKTLLQQVATGDDCDVVSGGKRALCAYRCHHSSSSSFYFCEINNVCNHKQKAKYNLAKRGIAAASPPNSSFAFVGWQHKTDGLAAICNGTFWLGVQPPNLPFPWGQGPHLIQCVTGPQKCTCQMASKSVERFNHGCTNVTDDRRTTDRQTLLHLHRYSQGPQTDRRRYGEMCRNR